MGTPSTLVWYVFLSILSTEILNGCFLAMPCNKTEDYLPPSTPPLPLPVQSPNDWMPYHDCVDFELTEFLYTKVQMSGNSIDTLLQLWCASLINHGILPGDINLYEQHDSLLATIDSTDRKSVV